MNLADVIAAELGVDSSLITSNTGPGDLPQWDSVGHVGVILAVEKAYGLTLTVMEQMDVESVSDLEDIIDG